MQFHAMRSQSAHCERNREKKNNREEQRLMPIKSELTREKYFIPGPSAKAKQFSINVGDVVRELKMHGRLPAVCSALRTRRFLESNNLRPPTISGPPSGQSTTVTYTYEFAEGA